MAPGRNCFLLPNTEEIDDAGDYNILIMGASYGSLLASKLPFSGHQVKLVCLPVEADLINAELPRRMPIGAGKTRSRSTRASCPARCPPPVPATSTGDYDLVGSPAQEPQYRSPGVRQLLDAVQGSKVPRMPIVNMPPLPYVKRIPNLNTDPLKSAYRSERVGFRSRIVDPVQPGPAGDPSPEEKVNVAAGHPADQFQGRALRS
jgi:hypothetical protein